MKPKLNFKELGKEVINLQSRIEERDDIIKHLMHANKVAKEVSNEIHKNLREMKIKMNKEKNEIFKEPKTEIKVWKRSLVMQIKKISNFKRSLTGL